MRYSKEEKQIIVSKIKSNPYNLQHAFELAALELPRRNKISISAFYYKKLKHEIKPILAVSSGEISIINNKNVNRNIINGEIVNKMLYTLFDGLNKEEVILYVSNNLDKKSKVQLIKSVL